MFSVAKIFVLLSVLSVATAIPSHIARNPHAHHDIAARAAAPEPIAEPVEVFQKRVVPPMNRRRKRGLNGRCAPSGSSSAPVPSNTNALAPSSSSKPEPTATPKAEPSSTKADPPATTSKSSVGGAVGSALDKLLSTTFKGDGTLLFLTKFEFYTDFNFPYRNCTPPVKLLLIHTYPFNAVLRHWTWSLWYHQQGY